MSLPLSPLSASSNPSAQSQLAATAAQRRRPQIHNQNQNHHQQQQEQDKPFELNNSSSAASTPTNQELGGQQYLHPNFIRNSQDFGGTRDPFPILAPIVAATPSESGSQSSSASTPSPVRSSFVARMGNLLNRNEDAAARPLLMDQRQQPQQSPSNAQSHAVASMPAAARTAVEANRQPASNFVEDPQDIVFSLSSPSNSGAAFVAINVNDALSPSSSVRHVGGTLGEMIAGAAPEDVFVYIFSFLDTHALTRVARINRAWQRVVYDASLWTRLDLSANYNRVNDDVILELVTGRRTALRSKATNNALAALALHSGAFRFSSLIYLSLEGCSAISDSALSALSTAPCSRSLRVLLLTDCNLLTANGVISLARSLPKLRKLELYGALDDYNVVPYLLQLHPYLDLGFFFMEYAARNGIQIEDNAVNYNINYEDDYQILSGRQSVAIGMHQRTRTQIPPADASSLSSSAASSSSGSVNSDGVRRVNLERTAACRHENRSSEMGAHLNRGCWGDVRGRIVYSNRIYHRAGNYPAEVLYSCQTHTDDDRADRDFFSCELCQQLFRPSSMFSPLICRVCFDHENLSNKMHWLSLQQNAVQNFSFGDIINKTIFIADRKNLPPTLKSYAKVQINFDYTLPDEKNEEDEKASLISNDSAARGPMSPASLHAALLQSMTARQGGPRPQPPAAAPPEQPPSQVAVVGLPVPPPTVGAGGLGGLDEDDEDLQRRERERNMQFAAATAATSSLAVPTYDRHAVPLPVFLQTNGERVGNAVDVLRTALQRAKSHDNSRALLIYNSDFSVELLSDRRVILDGREGEEHMRLTLQAWQHTLEILWPIFIVMFIVYHFIGRFNIYINLKGASRIDYAALLNNNSNNNFSLYYVLITLAAVIFFMGLMIFCAYRYREQCERCFKKFLVADIFLILAFGAAAMLFLLVLELFWPLDIASFVFAIWNFASLGLCSLYFTVPPFVHHGYLILLNAIMAILLSVTLPNWLILLFIALAASMDVFSELSPRLRVLAPFIIPQGVQFLYEVPRVIYTVGGLRLRAADLMWYGLMISVVGPFSTQAAAVAISCVLASVAVVCFVLPFIGIRFRPLPVAFAFVLLAFLVQSPLTIPYNFDRFFLGINNPSIA